MECVSGVFLVFPSREYECVCEFSFIDLYVHECLCECIVLCVCMHARNLCKCIMNLYTYI
jgi:hypothetical protein